MKRRNHWQGIANQHKCAGLNQGRPRMREKVYSASVVMHARIIKEVQREWINESKNLVVHEPSN